MFSPPEPFLFCECRSDMNIVKARRARSVAGAHGLHGLALTAVGRTPKRPVIAGADRVTAIPELRGNTAITGILDHAGLPSTLDLPANFGGKLKVVAAVVD